MVAFNATPRALKTSEIERASEHGEEPMKVRACWRSGDLSSAPASYKMIRDEVTIIGKLVTRGTRIAYEVEEASSRVSSRGASWDCQDEAQVALQIVVACYE